MRVLLESIIHFQSEEDFNKSTSLVFSELNKEEVFKALEQWWCPGEHDTNWYDAKDIDTNFLGYRYKAHDEEFLISLNEGLVIGLSRIIKFKDN